MMTEAKEYVPGSRNCKKVAELHIQPENECQW